MQFGVYVNPSAAQTEIFRENQVNTLAVDAVAQCVTTPSATMVLTENDEQILVFNKDRF